MRHGVGARSGELHVPIVRVGLHGTGKDAAGGGQAHAYGSTIPSRSAGGLPSDASGSGVGTIGAPCGNKSSGRAGSGDLVLPGCAVWLLWEEASRTSHATECGRAELLRAF